LKKRNVYDFKTKKVISVEEITLIKHLCHLTSRLLFLFFLCFSIFILFLQKPPFSYGYSIITLLIGWILSKTIPYSRTFMMMIKKEIRKQEKDEA